MYQTLPSPSWASQSKVSSTTSPSAVTVSLTQPRLDAVGDGPGLVGDGDDHVEAGAVGVVLDVGPPGARSQREPPVVRARSEVGGVEGDLLRAGGQGGRRGPVGGRGRRRSRRRVVAAAGEGEQEGEDGPCPGEQSGNERVVVMPASVLPGRRTPAERRVVDPAPGWEDRGVSEQPPYSPPPAHNPYQPAPWGGSPYSPYQLGPNGIPIGPPPDHPQTTTVLLLGHPRLRRVPGVVAVRLGDRASRAEGDRRVGRALRRSVQRQDRLRPRDRRQAASSSSASSAPSATSPSSLPSSPARALTAHPPARPHHRYTEEGHRVREVLTYSRRGNRLSPRQLDAWETHRHEWVVSGEDVYDERLRWADRFGLDRHRSWSRSAPAGGRPRWPSPHATPRSTCSPSRCGGPASPRPWRGSPRRGSPMSGCAPLTRCGPSSTGFRTAASPWAADVLPRPVAQDPAPQAPGRSPRSSPG